MITTFGFFSFLIQEEFTRFTNSDRRSIDARKGSLANSFSLLSSERCIASRRQRYDLHSLNAASILITQPGRIDEP